MPLLNTALAGAHLLVVDDQPDQLRLLIDLLRNAGCRISVGFDGSQAYQRALAISPDLILMDVRMPRMDGFAACRLLAADPRTCGIPVIFLTGYADIAMTVRALKSGAVDFLEKPFRDQQLLDAVNWAIAENGRKGSPYNGKLDASKIAVMGMSCGGIQAYAVATDPRVKLVGIFNSGILPAPSGPGAPAMEDIRKDQLDKLHTPIFYVTGDKTDIAYENGLDDYKRITKVPAIHTFKDGVSHGGTYSQPNGGDFARVAVAMLDWQLKGEKNESKMFLGANCGLCQEAGWHVSTKGYK